MINRDWCSVLAVAALVIGLLSPGSSQADDKSKPHPAPKPNTAPAAHAAVGFEEAETLRQAFILLAGANHDYNGHRKHAMAAVHAAVHVLDDGVMKHGTPHMKAATREHNVAVARAAAAAPRNPAIHELQGASDGQLRKAEALLVQVRATMAKNKESKVLGHVDRALKEIAIALRIR